MTEALLVELESHQNLKMGLPSNGEGAPTNKRLKGPLIEPLFQIDSFEQFGIDWRASDEWDGEGRAFLEFVIRLTFFEAFARRSVGSLVSLSL